MPVMGSTLYLLCKVFGSTVPLQTQPSLAGRGRYVGWERPVAGSGALLQHPDWANAGTSGQADDGMLLDWTPGSVSAHKGGDG